RQPPDIIERRLSDLPDLAQLGPQRRSLWSVLAGPAEHRAHRGEHLSELVVQLSGDLPQGGLARRDELLRELAAFRRQARKSGEQVSIRPDEIEARERDHDEGCAEKDEDLALNLCVDVLDAPGGLLLALVVLDQQPGDGRAERRLPRL